MTKHSHYHKDVSHLKTVDVYRLLELFGVTDQALGHAIKKLLCAGKRGAGKTFDQDVREAVDTLNRRLQMLAEDANRTDEFGERACTPILPRVPEGWTSINEPRAPWAAGCRLDFLMCNGLLETGVRYAAGMSFRGVVAWRFSYVAGPSLPECDGHD